MAGLVADKYYSAMAQQPPFDYSKLSAVERRLLDERLAAHARDPEGGSTREEVKARFLLQLHDLRAINNGSIGTNRESEELLGLQDWPK